MRVSPSQLVSGCILLRDVKGKTSRPIIPQNTVLTDKHISVLHNFLIDQVEVSERLKNGELFRPLSVSEKEQESNVTPKKEKDLNVLKLSFKDHYLFVVEEYKKIFDTWRNNIPINNLAIRNLILPLINRMDEIGSAVYTLHQYANKRDYFYHHSVSVSILSAYLGKKMGYQKGEWFQIGIAGLLSDAGMARLGEFAFKKEGMLTEDERIEVKNHPTYSYRMVEHITSIPYTVKLAILQHHERMDGSGYPLGLSQDKIHRFARIIAVCDIYHAMTSDRVYREKQSPFKVMEEIQKEQFSRLDIRVVKAFMNAIANFSIGTKVMLSNNQEGEIVYIDQKNPTRPILRLENGNVFTLSDHPDLHISKVL